MHPLFLEKYTIQKEFFAMSTGIEWALFCLCYVNFLTWLNEGRSYKTNIILTDTFEWLFCLLKVKPQKPPHWSSNPETDLVI
jgi:hypothetical protein